MSNITIQPPYVDKIKLYRKEADQSVTNSIVLVDDNHFQFPIRQYDDSLWIQLYLEMVGNLAADFRFNFSKPDAGDLIYWRYIGNVAGTLTEARGDGSSDQRVDVDPTTPILKRIDAYYYPATNNGGTLKFQWAQWTANVQATILYAGSCWALVNRLKWNV